MSRMEMDVLEHGLFDVQGSCGYRVWPHGRQHCTHVIIVLWLAGDAPDPVFIWSPGHLLSPEGTKEFGEGIEYALALAATLGRPGGA